MSDPTARMYVTCPGGTVRLWSPLTGVEAWVVPGRTGRPHPHAQRAATEALPIEEQDPEDHCDFCPARYLRTTPEKARVVRRPEGLIVRERVAARDLLGERAAFRRIANLFEIVTWSSWVARDSGRLTRDQRDWMEDYLRDPEGREHLRSVVSYRLRRLGLPEGEIRALDDGRLRDLASPFFGGTHELIIAERHYRPGARTTRDLASSGTLSPDDHREYLRFTLRAARAICEANPRVRRVAIFQNWLAPAGASFEHLHKQLVGLDVVGRALERKLALEKREPGAFQRYGLDFALRRRLAIAANRAAVAWADVGHAAPTVTLALRGPSIEPWELAGGALCGFSDLLHACHAAMGSRTPCNEQWYARPPGCRVPLPLHVHLAWRIHLPAGFEGATGIHVLPLLPEEVRDRMVERLRGLRARGRIRGVRIGDELDLEPGGLGEQGRASI